MACVSSSSSPSKFDFCKYTFAGSRNVLYTITHDRNISKNLSNILMSNILIPFL